MWRRNLLFLGLIGGGLFALGANLMPPRQPKPLTRFDASAYQAPDFTGVVERVNVSFRHQWREQKLQSASPAPDLAVARRLALGLMGTIPSLEEVRQFEYLPAEQRLPWWINHILQDCRFADDFAAHGFDLRRLVRVIACTEVFRLDSASEQEVGETEEKAWAVFPLSRLRPDQVVGGLLQASSVATLSAEAHILARLARFGQRNDFVKRYGDSGEDEFDGHGGTIPQRLLMMNGMLLHEKIKDGPFNASTQVGWMSADDARAVEAAYLCVLTRRPTPEEAEHFERFLADSSLGRNQRLEDLFWVLLNSTEFSWNH